MVEEVREVLLRFDDRTGQRHEARPTCLLRHHERPIRGEVVLADVDGLRDLVGVGRRVLERPHQSPM